MARKSEQSEDRRVKRSRKMMKQGLLELMKEKAFPSITARDITDRMDLNRGTFYLHFPDTSALLHSIESDVLCDAQNMIDASFSDTSPETLQRLFQVLLDYTEEHRELFHVLLLNDSSHFIDQMQSLVYQNGVGIIRSKHADADDKILKYSLSFITYGLIGIIKEWFRSDADMDKITLVQTADRMVSGATGQLFFSA